MASGPASASFGSTTIRRRTATTSLPAQPQEATTTSARRAQLLTAIGLAALAYRELALWSPATRDLPALEGWVFLASEIPPQLLLLVVAGVLWSRRLELRHAIGGPAARWTGYAAVATSLLLMAWGRFVSTPHLVLGSAIALGLTAAAWLGGRRLLRQTAAPLLLALLAVPVPSALSHALVHPLQLATARAASASLAVLGVTVVREADVLTLPNDLFMVIETCSGFGFIVTLTTLAAAWAVFRRTPLAHGLLLVLAAPAVAFAVNVARVVALILTPGSEAAGLHAAQGVALFVAGVGCLTAIDRLLHRLLGGSGQAALPAPPMQADDPSPSERDGPDPSGRGNRGPLPRAVAVCALLALLSVAVPRYAIEPNPPWSAALPDQLEGEAASRPEPVDARFLGSVHFVWSRSARYPVADEWVTAFFGAGDPAGPSVRSPKVALPGSGQRVIGRKTGDLAGLPVRLLETESRAGRLLSATAALGIGGLVSEAARELLGLDRSPFRRTEPPRVMRLVTPLAAGPEGREQARARLDRVGARLAPVLRGAAGAPTAGRRRDAPGESPERPLP